MLKTKTRLISTVVSLFFLLGSTIAAAHVNFDVNIGISGPPPQPPVPVVVVGPPQGYNSCYITQGMWYDNVWVPAHQQCEYVGPSGPSVWVSGYWGCIDVGPGGRCGQWRWYNRRMIPGNVAYYHPNHYHGYQNGPVYTHNHYREYQGGPVYSHNHYQEHQDGPVYSHNHYQEHQDGPVYVHGPY